MAKNNNKVPDNSAQITLFLQDDGAIDCQTEWHFPYDSKATDQEVETLITLIHGLSGFIHTRFYEVFKMGEAIEAGLKIKEQILERALYPEDPEDQLSGDIIFTPDEEFLEMVDENKKKSNGKNKTNGKENNIVDIQDFINSKDPNKLN